MQKREPRGTGQFRPRPRRARKRRSSDAEISLLLQSTLPDRTKGLTTMTLSYDPNELLVPHPVSMIRVKERGPPTEASLPDQRKRRNGYPPRTQVRVTATENPVRLADATTHPSGDATTTRRLSCSQKKNRGTQSIHRQHAQSSHENGDHSLSAIRIHQRQPHHLDLSSSITLRTSSRHFSASPEPTATENDSAASPRQSNGRVDCPSH